MSQKKIIRHAIEQLYGPCPVGDFVRANDWAHAIDWEKVRDQVAAEQPDFQWSDDQPADEEVAKSLIDEVRHAMLHQAGHSD